MRLLDQLFRRVLLWCDFGKYVDGIEEAQFEFADFEGWVPRQIAVRGPLQVRPGLLRGLIQRDGSGAHVELAEGGCVEKLVVTLPTRVQQAIAQTCSLQRFWSPVDLDALRQQLRSRPSPACASAAGGPSGGHTGDREDPAAVPSSEPIDVELHGLHIVLRTYTAEEMEQLSKESLRQTLQWAKEELPIAPGDGDSAVSRHSSPRPGSPPQQYRSVAQLPTAPRGGDAAKDLEHGQPGLAGTVSHSFFIRSVTTEQQQQRQQQEHGSQSKRV